MAVTREGGVRAPVEVAITLASGAQHTMPWDGQDRNTSFSFPGSDPIVRVEVDPARKLAAEIDILDNGVSASPQVGPALTLGGRLLFLFQVLAQFAGLFG